MDLVKPKICIISPAIKMGGVERASVNLANSFISLNAEVVFIALFKNQHFFTLENEVKYYEPSNFNVAKLSLPKTILYLRRIVRSENPQSILAFTKFYSAIVLIALKGLNYNIFISERSSPYYRWPCKIEIFSWVAYKVNPPSGIIAQTSIAASCQAKNHRYRIPITVIPNALREVTLYPGIKKEKIILAVGRFNDSSKGFDRLIESFAKVNFLDWRLVFAGGDEKGEYLKELARRLNINDKVEFWGQVHDIDLVYARASIFVIPSRTEGFPNSLCEAMAAGLPCISFDFIAGPREIISDGFDGIIVENGNIDKLAEAMTFLIRNKDERDRLGSNALEIRNTLEIMKIARKFLDFILSIK